MMDGQVGAIRAALDETRSHRHVDPRVRGEVRVRAVRAIPRRGRVRAAVRRPPRLPDGSGQRSRSARRGRARSRRGRRHGHGQARARVPRRDRRRARRVRRPGRGVPRQRRVRDGEGRRGSWAGSTATRSRSSTCSRSSAPAPTSILTYFAREVAERLGDADVSDLLVRARAQARIPGGVNSPVRAFGAVGGHPFFVARGERRVHRGHRRQPVPRLRAVLGGVDPRSCRPGDRRGRAAGRGRGHVVRRADARRGRAGRSDLRSGRRGREGAAGLVGHRSGDDRRAPRRGATGRDQDREVRGLLPRPPRRAARAGRKRRRHARAARVRPA